MQEVTLNVKGKTLGRAASKAAALLRGKHLASFQPNCLPDLRLHIINLPEIRTTGAKHEQKIYERYSGYPGGRNTVPFAKIFSAKPEWVFRHAVRGMLPNNRLRNRALRRLIIEK